jgi:hypothetical protein
MTNTGPKFVEITEAEKQDWHTPQKWRAGIPPPRRLPPPPPAPPPPAPRAAAARPPVVGARLSAVPAQAGVEDPALSAEAAEILRVLQIAPEVFQRYRGATPDVEPAITQDEILVALRMTVAECAELKKHWA